MMTKIVPAVALAITTLATVPASANPNYCQEDLGYGQASSFHWLVWLRLEPHWEGLRSDGQFVDAGCNVCLQLGLGSGGPIA